MTTHAMINARRRAVRGQLLRTFCKSDMAHRKPTSADLPSLGRNLQAPNLLLVIHIVR